MKSPQGIDIIKQIVADSDVLLENFRPGVMARLGLDYESVRTINEEIVYASISGFGQDSPLAKLPALDLVIQAMSGLMSVTGQREGPPTAGGVSIADVCAGMFCAWGITTALLARERTGHGRYLDVSMLDAVFSMLLTPLSRALYSDETPTRVGNRHPETYPVDSFPTLTGDIVLVGFSDGVFRKLMAVIGRPELADDPRFKSNDDRNTHEAELRAIISQWTSKQTADEALSKLAATSIPCSPVWTLDQVLNSDHVRSRELIDTGRHAKLGDVPLVPQPVKFSGAQRTIGQTVPMLGEHTEEVLRERLALDDAAIAALRNDGVI